MIVAIEKLRVRAARALCRRPARTEAPVLDESLLAQLQAALAGYVLGAALEPATDRGRHPALAVALPGLPTWLLTPAPGLARLGENGARRRRRRCALLRIA